LRRGPTQRSDDLVVAGRAARSIAARGKGKVFCGSGSRRPTGLRYHRAGTPTIGTRSGPDPPALTNGRPGPDLPTRSAGTIGSSQGRELGFPKTVAYPRAADAIGRRPGDIRVGRTGPARRPESQGASLRVFKATATKLQGAGKDRPRGF